MVFDAKLFLKLANFKKNKFLQFVLGQPEVENVQFYLISTNFLSSFILITSAIILNISSSFNRALKITTICLNFWPPGYFKRALTIFNIWK